MIIRYHSCGGEITKEKIDWVEVFTHAVGEVELVCKRSEDNPYYNPNDDYEGHFPVLPEDVLWIEEG